MFVLNEQVRLFGVEGDTNPYALSGVVRVRERVQGMSSRLGLTSKVLGKSSERKVRLRTKRIIGILNLASKEHKQYSKNSIKSSKARATIINK